MRYRSIESLRDHIRELRSLHIGWKNICIATDILTEDGRPNTKLAQDIGYKIVKVHGVEQPYQPHDPAVRERLGLKPVCSECGRSVRRPASHSSSRKRVNYKRLLLELAMPALDDIAHANGLTGATRSERALTAYKTIKKELTHVH